MAILMGALLTLVWIAGFAMCERSPVQQSGMKTGNERLDQPSVRRWLIRPMQWLLEKSGILDRLQPFMSALHSKLYVLHGTSWTVEATKQFTVFAIGCGYISAIGGAWLSALSGERMLLYLGLLLGAAIPTAKWRDTVSKFEQRKQNILLDIPEVMSKLMLLLGAGETVQRALIRCTDRREDKEKRDNALLIELRRANEEVRNGQSFSAAMEAFSRRCAVQEVSLFTTTILLNYRRGGDRLVLSLKELSYSLWEKTKSCCPLKRRGSIIKARISASGNISYFNGACCFTGYLNDGRINQSFMGEIKMKKWTDKIQKFWREEEGLGTLEIVLIIAVVIILALLFKDWIINLLQKLMGDADDKANEIFN